MRIRIFRTSEVEEEVADRLREKLAAVFPASVQPGGRIALLPGEFDERRGQYRSTAILRRLRPLVRPGELLLTITGADLYVPGLNFVFGEADFRGRCAIISLARLRAAGLGQVLTDELFRRRILTEAVHELGHLLGFPHCSEVSCAMHFSNTLMDTDRKAPAFCPRCREALP